MLGSCVPGHVPFCPHIPSSQKYIQIGPCVEIVGVLFRKAALMVQSAIGGVLLGPNVCSFLLHSQEGRVLVSSEKPEVGLVSASSRSIHVGSQLCGS